MGGSFATADYCPHFIARSNGLCSRSDNAPSTNYRGEVRRTSSRHRLRCYLASARLLRCSLDPLFATMKRCHQISSLAMALIPSLVVCPRASPLVGVRDRGFDVLLHKRRARRLRERRLD